MYYGMFRKRTEGKGKEGSGCIGKKRAWENGGGLVEELIKSRQVAGQCTLQAKHLMTTTCPVCSLNSLLALF